MDRKLKEISPLAPLHNPPGVLGIEVARSVLPDLPHVAVFDTAFFHDLPPAASTYAIDRELGERWDMRRYGFHGTSHQYISEQAAIFLGTAARVAESDRAASRQRGVGGRDRRRPAGGHIDGPDADGGPGHGHPCRRCRPGHYLLPVAHRRDDRGRDRDDAQSPFRNARAMRRGRLPQCARADRLRRCRAQLAYDIYIHRLRKYIGAYMAVLGTTDVITFTAGVGENDAAVRQDALTGWPPWASTSTRSSTGVRPAGRGESRPTSSSTTVLVIPTDEELAIARAASQ